MNDAERNRLAVKAVRNIAMGMVIKYTIIYTMARAFRKAAERASSSR